MSRNKPRSLYNLVMIIIISFITIPFVTIEIIKNMIKNGERFDFLIMPLLLSLSIIIIVIVLLVITAKNNLPKKEEKEILTTRLFRKILLW